MQTHKVLTRPATPGFTIIFVLLLGACTGNATTGKEQADAPAAEAAAPAPLSAAGLRIMSYNVLKYGNECQGSNSKMHKYLRTIVSYANPDILGLMKVASIKQSPGDNNGDAPPGFANNIRDEALNAAFSSRYAVCPYTNKAGGKDINLLFYNQQKLGYAGMQTLLTNITDFNLYKLYIKSPNLASTHDTSFLYILLNHTESGDKSQDRDAQMLSILQALHKTFKVLPDLIDMGDYNLRNTEERGYHMLVSNTDAGFRFSDPPFALDHAVSYPADWEKDPEPYAKFLTTSTRKKDDEPNDCGTGGGAKFWFDHILLSPSIASGAGRFRYVPRSFKVIGNDGNRVGRSVNADKHPNTAVSPEVAEALFQFSNKYPVVLELEPSQKTAR